MTKNKFFNYVLPKLNASKEPNQWFIEPFAEGLENACQIKGYSMVNIKYPRLTMWQLIQQGWLPQVYDNFQYNQILGDKDDICNHQWVNYVREHRHKYPNLEDCQNKLLEQIKEIAKKSSQIYLTNKDYYLLSIPKNSMIYCSLFWLSKITYNKLIQWVREKMPVTKNIYLHTTEEIELPDFSCVVQKESNFLYKCLT